MVLDGDETVQAWYLRPDGSQEDIAKAAYDDAVAHLKKEFEGKPADLAWIEGRKSLAEIRAEAQTMESQYSSVSPGKKTVMQWQVIRRCSNARLSGSHVR